MNKMRGVQLKNAIFIFSESPYCTSTISLIPWPRHPDLWTMPSTEVEVEVRKFDSCPLQPRANTV